MSGACQNKIQRDGPNGPVFVNCTSCDLCRQSQLTNMVGRCLLEDESALRTSFLTLTYANDMQHGATEVIPEPERGYRQFQNMMKRLRKNKHIVRYLVALEHGRNGQEKLHFHVLLFWINKVPKLPPVGAQKQMWEYWPHGFTFVDEATAKSMGYVAKYLLKEQTLDEKGKPKLSGSRRDNVVRDPQEKAIEKRQRLDMALAAGFDTYNEYKQWQDDNPDHMVRMSKNPAFGLGHSSVPDEYKPLAVMARLLVKQGLPFTRKYKHPKGFYHSGGTVRFVNYFMANQRMAAEYYRLYCKEYYKVHGAGDPPISNVECPQGRTERERVLADAYGPKSWTRQFEHEDLQTQTDQFAGVPLPAYEARDRKTFAKYYEKVLYYSNAKVALYKRRDGRILAVKEIEIAATEFSTSYSRDKNHKAKAKGYQRWPVKDRKELLALARGYRTATQAQSGQPWKRAWNKPGDVECPF